MEFDKSKVYTALNADELKIGSKVIVADTIDELKQYIESDCDINTIDNIMPEYCQNRFALSNSCYNLAYLVSEPEENKLKWTDLKIGDVITNDDIIAMVVIIDKAVTTSYHICLGDSSWLSDNDLEKWEKVEK